MGAASRRLTAIGLAGMFLGGTLLCGCGAGSSPRGHSASRPRPRRVFVAWDGSGFARFFKTYERQMIAAVQRLAREHDEVLMAVLDGQPLTTAEVFSVDFAQRVDTEADSEERKEIQNALASGLVHKLLRRQPEVVSGSGQLQGLLLATEMHDIDTILMWTDGIVNEPANQFDLSHASQHEVQEEIRDWQPRLKGLAGKHVILIGVGHGVHSVETVERAKHLFEALVKGNEAELGWTPVFEGQAQ